MRGDIAEVADIAFDCVACGLCALRCPAELIQHEVGVLAKRLTGRYLRKESKEVDDRLDQVRTGKFDKEYAELMAMDKTTLSKLYYDRDIEP
jgi:ferredoxin